MIGFTATPTFQYDDLMHTNYALKIAETSCPNFLKRQDISFYKEISNFIASCKSEQGYSFNSSGPPNVFATCYVPDSLTSGGLI